MLNLTRRLGLDFEEGVVLGLLRRFEDDFQTESSVHIARNVMQNQQPLILYPRGLRPALLVLALLAMWWLRPPGLARADDPVEASTTPTVLPVDRWGGWADVDSDGDLDLATSGGHVTIYLNSQGVISSEPDWSSAESGNYGALAWGDIDGDGDLDLAAFNNTTTDIEFYRNQGTLPETSPDMTMTLNIGYTVQALAWGDMNGDSKLDLVAGLGGGHPVKIYLSQNDGFTTPPITTSTNCNTQWCSIDLADMDKDGDLDLAMDRDPDVAVYTNQGDGTLTGPLSLPNANHVIGWGDENNDGYPELAVFGAHQHPNLNPLQCCLRVYKNINGILQTGSYWQPSDYDNAWGGTWGDMDGDDDLDLAVGSVIPAWGGEPARIYRNINGNLELTTAWTVAGVSIGTWLDLENDGDLDLYAGVNGVFLNQRAPLVLDWQSAETDYSRSVAWGDMDNDGDLDLAVGNAPRQSSGAIVAEANRVYENQNGVLTLSSWSETPYDPTFSVAWGDMNNDGYLDLALGNYNNIQNKVYLNVAGTLSNTPVWSSNELSPTTSVAWGDMNNDGYLDLAVGNDKGHSNNVYLNQSGLLQTTPAWTSTKTDSTRSVAWGDVDGDGDLDLAVGNIGFNYIYFNDGGMLQTIPGWVSADNQDTYSVAWGDVDGDGDLDLAAGDPVEKVYLNQNGQLQTNPSWISGAGSIVRDLAWGDVDNDGDLDLANGVWGGTEFIEIAPSSLYINVNGQLQTSADNPWQFGLTPSPGLGINDVAWGDYDNDGDLDLMTAVLKGDAAPGGISSGKNQLYLNRRAGQPLNWDDVPASIVLDPSVRRMAPANFFAGPPLQTGQTIPFTYTLKRQGGEPFSRVVGKYSPDGGRNWLPAMATSSDTLTREVEPFGGPYTGLAGYWTLDDNSGITATDLSRFKFDGTLFNTPTWTTDTPPLLSNFSPAALSFDGVDDYVNVGNPANLNFTGQIAIAAWIKPAATDGARNIVAHGHSASSEVYLRIANGEYQIGSWNGTDYTASYSIPAGDLNTWVHLAGVYDGSTWRLYRNGIQVSVNTTAVGALSVNENWAIGARGTGTERFFKGLIDDVRIYNRALSAAEIAQIANPQPQVYTWDTFASGFFGNSDQVYFRLEAYPSFKPQPNSTPGPYLRGYVSTETFYPFRVRGTQVRVLSGTLPISGAIVYKLPAGADKGGLPLGSSDSPFTTDNNGYLQGRGEIAIGDTLVALLPVSPPGWTEVFSDDVELYYTNISPTPTGLAAYTVSQPGVQMLTVSADKPLLLFNLDVSLEWDARNDPTYLNKLKADLQRTSEFLFDLTNGQAALGRINLFQNRHNWLDAHIRVYANNRLRPYAALGGLVTQVLTDPLVSTLSYDLGQVHMGATWNRFGDASGDNLAEDWARALAHELGHYLFFLDDHYLGWDNDNLLTPVEGCFGIMADAYRDDFTEFHPGGPNWTDQCQNTLANQEAGRFDWQTIQTFYPLNAPASANDNPGPTSLPLALTQIQVSEPSSPANTLPVPNFYLKHNGDRYLPSPNARAFLFQDRRLIDLGSPIEDKVIARGARPGDRLCLYELEAERFGCKDISLGSDDQLVINDYPGWRPDLIVTPVTTKTIALSVANLSNVQSLQAQLFLSDDDAPDPQPLNPLGPNYSGTFDDLDRFSTPALEGYFHVTGLININGQPTSVEAITDYAIGGNPTNHKSTNHKSTNHKSTNHKSTNHKSAPVVSADGQVILSGRDLTFGPNQFYALQAATIVSPTLPWATVVGQGYRLLTSANAPDLSEASISFNYLGRDVPAGTENQDWLRIHYFDGNAWQALPTRLDTRHNIASAPAQGEGLYALMASLPIPLQGLGWNLIAYPIQETRPVSEALVSIEGAYSTVYGQDFSDPNDPWKIYDVAAPAWVNDLAQLEFPKAYWINITDASQPIFVKPAGQIQSAEAGSGPPATYYGAVLSSPALTPTVGMAVTAWIEGNPCGQTQTISGDLHGQAQVVYAINVIGENPTSPNGCGTAGKTVSFRLNDQAVQPTTPWINDRAREVSLNQSGDPGPIFFPILFKN
jgi:hypothetical protein